MVLSLRKQTLGSGIRWAALLALCCSVNLVQAQFRDLDTAPVTKLETPEEPDLLPTDEEFIAPVVDADELEEVVEVVAPKVEPEPEQPAAPEPEAEPKPQARPEPVPMPELIELKKPQKTEKQTSEIKSPTDSFREPVAKESTTPIHAATFQKVQPGTTSAAELIKHWGEPTKSETHEDETKSLFYHLPAFKQVNVELKDDVVSSLLVHLSEPLDAEKVAQELDLNQFIPVPVPDELGEVLGQAYPERGLMFSFTEQADALKVSAILLEPISAEMFRLRAQYDFDHAYQRSLVDLETAISLDPQDAESYWLQAQYLDAVGKSRDALKSVQKSIRLKPTNPLYRLTRARLYAKNNRLQTAIDEVKAILAELELPNEVGGKAHNLLGDLLAIGPNADHQEALKHHLKAIDLASKSVEEPRFAIRRMAKHVLVNAHLSVARDIAMGNFQRQAEVVPKWLLRATEMADEFISDDQGDELLQMQIFRDTLASYAELQQGSFDAAVATEEAIKTGRELIANASDDLYKMGIERLLAETLLHAAKISRSRGKHDSAILYATNALALLDDTKQQWDPTPHDKYLEAQLFFTVGSIHAIQDDDHTEAVEWYAKARVAFVASNFVSPLYSIRGHGETYVSMGLSFWEVGERDKAIQLTKTGAELMKDAVEDGSLHIKAMSVPYNNLATMHGKMGRSDKSQEYQQLVTRVAQLTKDGATQK